MASPNPLQRTTRVVHLPLLLLAALFLGPMIWLLAMSLQPREQVGKVPPELMPRQYYITSAGEQVIVTPPHPIGTPKLLVLPSAGPHAQRQLLVEPRAFQDGKLRERVRVADQEREETFDAQLLRHVSATDVVVKEWQLSKYNKREPRVFYVAEIGRAHV